MQIFTDGSAISNPVPTGAGAVIRKNGPISLRIKLAKEVTSSETSYKGELEAIKISADYTKENISNSTENMHIFGDCQAAIHVITQQNNDNYQRLTISSIRENLFDISTKVKSIKIIYCPAHKGIKDNETADTLAKIATKKAKTLEPTYNITTLDIKTETSKLTHKKCQRRYIERLSSNTM